MTASIPTVRPRSVQASASVQAKRVFCLARLLTGITAGVCLIGHLAVMVWTYLTPEPDSAPVDAWLVDARVWLLIFLFWAGVMWLARRPLRLDR